MCLWLTSENGQAVLRVEDTGVGIPADAIPHVFERFFRAEHSRSSMWRSWPRTGTGQMDRGAAPWKNRSRKPAGSRGSRFTVRLPQVTDLRRFYIST